jgi:hypothetical protein
MVLIDGAHRDLGLLGLVKRTFEKVIKNLGNKGNRYSRIYKLLHRVPLSLLQRLWKALEETLDCFLRSPSLFCTIHETPTFSTLYLLIFNHPILGC